MDLKDSLRLERYKLVTERQRYFTELARDSFASYIRLLAGLTAGGITLVSTRSKLELMPQVVVQLVDAIVYLVTFLGCVAIVQILFCLARWRGFRRAESEINPDTPPPDWWWWLFETMYACAIAFSIYLAWCVKSGVPALIGLVQ